MTSETQSDTLQFTRAWLVATFGWSVKMEDRAALIALNLRRGKLVVVREGFDGEIVIEVR